MPRIIVKPGFIKGKNHRSTFAQYIATRENVEKISQSNQELKPTTRQEKLVNELLRDFPNSKKLSEYKSFLDESNRGNASAFIQAVLEDNMEKVLKKENYVEYIAKRPRAEKLGEHGLFSMKDKPINLKKVMEEVRNHEGTVWTQIISLTREDAERLGYDNAESWKQLCRSKTSVIADAMKINPNNLVWYGAFHNEGHHPHIHMILYSTKQKEGFLTTQGIKQIESAFAKEIFKQDLIQLYKEQTSSRDNLKKVSRTVIREILHELNENSDELHTQLASKLCEIKESLEGYHGKRVFAYIPKESKELIHECVKLIEEDPRVKELYELWKVSKQEIQRTYNDKLIEQLPLSAREEFKSIKNMILTEVLESDLSEYDEGTEPLINWKELPSYAIQHEEEAEEILPPMLNQSIRLLNSLTKIFRQHFELDRFNALENVDQKEMKKIMDKKFRQGQKMG